MSSSYTKTRIMVEWRNVSYDEVSPETGQSSDASRRCLPVCGILMGIGYALAPAVMGVPGAQLPVSAYTVGFLLVKAGGALIDNMAWLFAIGAAVGLSADNDGTAGLAGLVSFLMMQQLLNPGVVSAVRTLEEGTATYIAFRRSPATPSSAFWLPSSALPATTSSRIPSCLTGWHSSPASASLQSLPV